MKNLTATGVLAREEDAAALFPFTNPLSGTVTPYRLYKADTSYKVKVIINKKRGPLKRRTVYIKKEW